MTNKVMPKHKITLGIIIRSTIFNIIFFIASAIMSIMITATIFLPSIVGIGVAYVWSKASLFLLNHICHIKYHITGLENIPHGTKVIFASKHQSAWETIAYQAFFCPTSFMFKKELLYIPLFGLAILKTGGIPVNRGHGNKKMIADITKKFAQRLKHKNIIVFPEGTRTAPGAAPNYRSGLSFITQNLHACVIPVAMNSGLFWPKGSFLKFPGTIEIRLLPPIYTGDISHLEFQKRLIDSIETAMQSINKQ